MVDEGTRERKGREERNSVSTECAGFVCVAASDSVGFDEREILSKRQCAVLVSYLFEGRV